MADDLKGALPESWNCVDCGVNTAPGCLNRAEMEKALGGGVIRKQQGVEITYDDRSEVYTVRDAIWKQAGMDAMGGCVCVGCLEKRLGRNLRPKDFQRGHPFNRMPGTARLLNRRGD
jgi:hypothetical protein